MSTTVEPRTSPDYRYDAGDQDRFAHYVPAAQLAQALVDGLPVVALCGKKWIPCRDPNRFPTCPTCKDLYELLPEESN